MLDLCSVHLFQRNIAQTLVAPLLLTLCCFFVLPTSTAWPIPAPKGVKIGSRGRFHPRLYLNFGYDSNIYNRSNQSDIRDGSRLGNIDGAPLLSIRPGLELDIPTKSVEFYLGGFANYTHFFPQIPNPIINTITASADLSLRFLPRSPFSILIYNNFSRNTGDNVSAQDVFARTLFYYAPGTQTGAVYITHNNSAGITFTIKPGGGALTFDVGYRFAFGFYPNENLDFNSHNFAFNIRWNFFPRTAFTFDSSFVIKNYAPRFSSREGTNVDAMPLKAYVGIAGQLTNRILLRARVGGGYTFSADRSAEGLPNDNWGMVVGNIDFTYKFRLTTFIRLGFRHDFNPSQFSNFYNETSGYIEFQTQFGSTRPVVLGIKGNGGYLGYGKIPVNINVGGGTGNVRFNSRNINDDNTINRGDLFVRGDLNLDWYVYPFWMIGINANIDYRNSNTFVVLSNNNQIGFGYIKFQVLLKTELAY